MFHVSLHLYLPNMPRSSPTTPTKSLSFDSKHPEVIEDSVMEGGQDDRWDPPYKTF